MDLAIHWQQHAESVTPTKTEHRQNEKSPEHHFHGYRFANWRKGFTSKSIWRLQRGQHLQKHSKWRTHKSRLGFKTEGQNGGKKLDYSNHLNTEHLNTWFIWIPDSMGVWYSNGKLTWLADHSNAIYFDKPTQIYHSNTRLVRYSDGYCSYSTVEASKNNSGDHKYS